MDKPAEPIALVDMDGTLCDFHGAMAREMAELRAPGEDPAFDYDEKIPHIEKRRHMVKSQVGFWANLEPLKLGFELLGILTDLRFKPHILTKGPGRVSSAWQEKFDWCKKWVPELPITMSQDKGLVYGKVLVDDWPRYYERWMEWRPRGVVIVPAQDWNLVCNHPNVIRYDGTNYREVYDRLREVRATAGD